MVEGQDWQVWEEHGRLAFLDAGGLLDLPLPALIGAHQVPTPASRWRRSGRSGWTRPPAPRRWRGPSGRRGCSGCRHGPLAEAAGAAELWLDGGHNPAAGAALAEALGRLPPRPLHLVVGMLRTKDAAGFLAPLAARARSLSAVSDSRRGGDADRGGDGGGGTRRGLRRRRRRRTCRGDRRDRRGRAGRAILICGSLYLAGRVLRENG